MPAAPESLMVKDVLPAVEITLNRPEQLNALSTALMKELLAELDRQARRPEVRVIVLKGAGRAFSAGHDLKELQGRTLDEEREVFRICRELMQKIQSVPQPVIAAVQGIATAAGCQLVATCDLAVATEDSRFATSGVRFGLFCSTPGVAIARNLSRKHALEERWGLVNRVVPPGRLDAAVGELVAELAALSPLALRIGKEGFYRQVELPQASAYELMSEAISRNAVAGDGQEGISAFVEKRKPRWTGE